VKHLNDLRIYKNGGCTDYGDVSVVITVHNAFKV